MALIYITGAPGAGKSTLQRELDSRGYETHDMDDSDMGGAHNKLTGERVKIPPAKQRTPSWFDEHEWRVDRPAIEKLKSRADDKNIFVCGVAASDGEIIPLFDKILYLGLDDKVLIERLSSRTDNDFGKNEFELQDILERKRGLDAKYLALDVTILNASGSVTEVTNAIVAQV